MSTYYQALSVSFAADAAAIKKAYHKVSLLCHPDKTVHIPASERAQREHFFKLANAAFEVLSDPHKRKLYDKQLGINQIEDQPQAGYFSSARPNAHQRPPVWPQFGQRPPRQNKTSPLPRLPTYLHGLHETTHRFSESAAGTPPDFHWYYCQLNERDRVATLTYSSWLGWKLSIEIAAHFRVVGKPVIPEKPVQNTIMVRLPLQRCSGAQAPYEVALDLMGTPDSRHAILSSMLIQTKQSLELMVELTLVSEDLSKTLLGSPLWKWSYKIEYGPLCSALILKVTSVMFYPFNPQMALASTEGLHSMPYPEGSPMRGLQNMFPDIRIEKLSPGSYCRQEEQRGVEFWRLLALGFK